MIPGVGNNKHLKDLQVDEKELGRVVAIINSMTSQERHKHSILNGSRRKRIASGSGTTVQDVNQLLKNYDNVMKMMKKINKGGLKKFGRGFSPFK